MKSREIVKRAITFTDPPRIPCNFDSNRTPDNGHLYGEDFLWVFVDKPANFQMEPNETKKTDEWGCVWEQLDQRTFGEPTFFPLEGVSDLGSYQIPEFNVPERYRSIEKSVAENAGDKYVLGMLPHGLFQILLHLFGFSDFMLQLTTNRVNMEKLLDVLQDSVISSIEMMGERGVDGVILIDDMGLQDSLMIGPPMWREMWKPRYAKVIDAAHRHGMEVFIHCCGHIVEIMDDLIEIGLDVIQMDQQDNMGLTLLGERFSGRICFFCSLDIQTTLELEGPEIEKRVDEMINELATPHGGFMAKTYPQPEAIGAMHAYMSTMAAAFRSYDVRAVAGS